MRKWYQACLATIALLSLGALVVYRHEYNKLRYVLEVLNYFGNREGARCNETWTMVNEGNLHTYSKHYDSNENFDEPIPSWQRLTDKIYLYSAYRTNVGQVRTVGIAKLEQSPSLTLSCDILYLNEDDRIDYFAGKLTYESTDLSAGKKIVMQKDRKRDTYEALNLICNYEENKLNKIVTGVKFSTKSNTPRGEAENNEMTVILPVRELKNAHTDRNNEKSSSTNYEMVAGLCVASFDSRPLIYKDMADFITFHTSLGFDRFIVYDFGGIALKFNDLTKRLLSKIFAVPLTSKFATYTTLPWNFPFSQVPVDVVRSVVYTDCLYRTRGKIDIVATLTWDEYIVLKYHSTIAKLLLDFDKTDYGADRYKLSTINLCLDRMDDPPKIFTYKKLVDVDPIFIYRQSKSSSIKMAIETNVTKREPSLDLIAVNRYEENCDRSKNADLRAVSSDDRYVGKFSKLLKNSTLF